MRAFIIQPAAAISISGFHWADTLLIQTLPTNHEVLTGSAGLRGERGQVKSGNQSDAMDATQIAQAPRLDGTFMTNVQYRLDRSGEVGSRRVPGKPIAVSGPPGPPTEHVGEVVLRIETVGTFCKCHAGHCTQSASRIAVKPTGAPRFTRYEVLGFGVANGAPALSVDVPQPCG
jgi:hypothetical protein